MPLYEYQCPSCNKVHEVVQKFADAPLTQCPECNGPVSKLISMNSFALKGSGWYTTDYKRSNKAPISTDAPAATVAPAAPVVAAPVAAPAAAPTSSPAKAP